MSEAKYFPHSSHLYFEYLVEFTFDLPSLQSIESTVNDLITGSGTEISEHVDDVGDTGGESEHSLEESEKALKLRSNGASSLS